jgi:polyribonucleotide nucleotidyltransferase
MVERLSVKIGSEEIHFETGRIARQAHGAVLVTQGESMVLSTACMSPDVRPGTDFFPMTVEYREKSSAAGRIPGNFFRREARPSEREILTCRLTDRPLRPLFPKGFYNEILVFSTVFSADNVNNPDVMSINGASAALHISQMPFAGPIGAVRIGLIDGELVVNPPMEDMERSQLDLVMAGTREAVTMVEGEADELSEDKMLEALELGHENIKRICDCIDELRSKVGLEKIVFTPAEVEEGVMADVTRLAGSRLIEAFLVREKHARQAAIDALKAEIKQSLLAEYGEERFAEAEGQVSQAFSKLSKAQMRNHVIDKQTRVDGRRPDEIRQITIEVGFLPRTHGSALFTRGETQAIVTTTLGTSRDEQRLDELSGEEFRRFMLHYNFPSYSVGEVRRVMGPGRREIGHGKLAERSLARMLPVEGEETDFPYVIRVLSDVTESNGSSSMATVCGGTLSLMDAGVPLKAPVAGIAMGLIKEGERAVVLSDILGDEDHLGDMDFKICGSRNGITAFQMDCKIAGVSRELMTTALQQAREGRLHILGKMEEALPDSRPEISPYAPRIYTIKIPVDSIREVIGPGGKIIREIQAKSGAEIEIQDDGTVHVAAVNHENADAAIQLIRSITAVPEVGQLYKGVVTRLMNFGAFVSIVGNKEGLVHISELAPGRVETVEDVVSVGDEINIKVIEIDRMGRVNLSKVEADRELGLIADDEFEEEGGGGDRPPRDRDRGGDRGGRGGGDRGGRSGGGSRGGSGGGRSGGGSRRR